MLINKNVYSCSDEDDHTWILKPALFFCSWILKNSCKFPPWIFELHFILKLGESEKQKCVKEFAQSAEWFMRLLQPDRNYSSHFPVKVLSDECVCFFLFFFLSQGPKNTVQVSSLNLFPAFVPRHDIPSVKFSAQKKPSWLFHVTGLQRAG